MNPENPIVKLCVAGMKAESEGQMEEARLLFLQAWDQSKDDYEACISAHYVARHQQTPEETLQWNQLSLEKAKAINDERVQGFYPSLYLNLGKAHEELGDLKQARACYELAAACLTDVSSGRYRDVVQDGIQRGLQRVS